MTIVIASTALATIAGHAAAAGPLEACGILVGTGGRIDAALPADNVAADPARAFEIDPAALIAAHRGERAGTAIAGWYHSHPDGVAQPSATDAARAAPDGRLWLIAAGGTIAAWRAGPGGAVHGRFTPVALVAA